MFRLKPVYLFLLLAVFLTSCDLFSQPTKTPEVVAESTAEVTTEPTAEPTSEVTSEPTGEVTSEPTGEVTSEPTGEVTSEPTGEVTSEPTGEVTSEPTGEVTSEPTREVTSEPTGTTENCAISMSGQSFYISGGGGGLTSQKPTSGAADWRDVNVVIRNAINPITPNATNDVAILIVDDFNGDIPSDTLGGALLDDSALKSQRISHGMLVYEHTVNLLINLFNDLYPSHYKVTMPSVPGTSGNDNIIFELPTRKKLVVQQVPSAGPQSPYNTAQIQVNISQAIKDLGTQFGIKKFVVNMSFIILPCQTVRDFEEQLARSASPISFDDYVATVMTRNPDPAIRDFEAWIKNQIDKLYRIQNDPLYINLINEVGRGGEIIFVSAAGNYGDKMASGSGFWFYPGAWPEVINVSGEQYNRTWDWWLQSNLGEIKLPAAWFNYQIIRENGSQPPLQILTPYYYAGTSFAAPVMSVITALYQSETEALSPESCPFNKFPPDFAAVPYLSPGSIPNFMAARVMSGC